MKKNCVVLDGKVINVGDWDYQTSLVEVAEGEWEEVATNPLPEGATVEEMECEQRPDGSWVTVGYEPTENPTDKRLNAMTKQILTLMEMM